MLSTVASRYRKASITDSLILLVALLVLLNQAQTVQASPVSVVDDDRNTVTLVQPARRIISLAPSMTELLYSLGAGNRIVGVMAHSDFPPEASALPVVGRHDLLDMEGILALNPDLIVAWRSGNPRASLQRLRELGLTVYIAEPESLESVASHLQRLGVLTGQQELGNMLARTFLDQLENLDQTHADRTPVSVFYQVWHAPMISVGGAELINDMISLCGGHNIFADLRVGPRVDAESVINSNPDVIIASGSDSAYPQWLNDWRRWPDINAVANNHLYAIPPDLVQRHSLRALQGVRQMCEHIDRARTVDSGRRLR